MALDDVCYATSDDGLELPVIDVGHPAFAVTVTDEELTAMAAQFIEEAQRQAHLPPESQQAMLREAFKGSRLGQALMGAAGGFLDGITTYLLKLGPEHLGTCEWSVPMDQRIAASFPAFGARLRLQDMAQLLADGILAASSASPDAGAARPLWFLNIAGGPAADSWNTLLRLHRADPAWLAARRIIIAVLDPDERGAAFGARAVAALTSAVGPLAGLDVDFRRISYDWRETDALPRILDQLRDAGASANPICAISSEGGLFEYGSDEEIVANLATLRAIVPRDAIIAGSVTRDDGPSRIAQGASRVAVHPRTLDAFRALVERGGWTLDHVIQGPFSFNVRLRLRA